MSLVTVIMPVRNAEDFLDDALASISAQSLSDFKCLCLDDCSTDKTPEILDAHANRDARFSIARSSSPLGVANALNQLLSEVNTAYVARMDADDISAPERLATQLEHARKATGPTLTGARTGIIGEPTQGWLNYVEWLNSLVSTEDIEREAFTDNPIPHPTWFARTEVLTRSGGYREGLFPEDYDLLLRLMADGVKMCKVDEELLFWRDHPRRETRQSPRCDADNTLVMKAAHFARMWKISGKNRPLAIRGIGKTGKVLLRALVDNNAEPNFFIDPAKTGAKVAGFDVLAPTDARARAALVLVAVRPRSVRRLIASELRETGQTLGRDYLWFY